MPVPSDSKSPNVEDSAHSPPLNDSSPLENDVSKTALVKQREMAPEPVTPKQRESITVDEPPIDDAGTQGLKDPELKKDVSPSPTPPLRRSQRLKDKTQETKEPIRLSNDWI